MGNGILIVFLKNEFRKFFPFGLALFVKELHFGVYRGYLMLRAQPCIHDCVSLRREREGIFHILIVLRAVQLPIVYRHALGNVGRGGKLCLAINDKHCFAVYRRMERKNKVAVFLLGRSGRFGIRSLCIRGCGRLVPRLLCFVKLLLHKLHLELHSFDIRVAIVLACGQAKKYKYHQHSRQNFFHYHSS